MDKKKIIQLAVIIIAFGGSGIVLYRGFFKSSAPPARMVTPVNVPASGAASGAANPLLPYGSSFDVKGTLKKQQLQFDAISFPSLATSSEVGIYDDASRAYTQPLVK